MLCAIARIDTQSREKLSALQQAAERFGITVHKIYGHITLATYMGEDDRAFIASCKEILSACTPFSVYYEKVEVLSATPLLWHLRERKTRSLTCIMLLRRNGGIL